MATPAAVLSVLVTANTTNATRGLIRFNSHLGATESSANRALGAVKTMAKGAAIGTGIGLGYAIKKAADFEQQLDSLGSVSGATGREMERFRKQAMKAGADTKFSALDAAKAQTELAKGGATVAQIAKGGLRSALALAAAGELDLALAAETSANAMNLFALEGKDAMKVADQLATAANATTADVEDFAVALKMGGSVAKMAGLSFTETVLSLEALAKIGIRNSDAGTSLKTAIIQLLKPTEKQKELADKLNMSFVDQEGHFKSMADISEMLRKRLGGMTDAQRTATLATLAGTDGVRTLSALYDAGPAKLDKWKAGLEKSGTAAKVAAEKQDNLKGKLENLQGSIETAAIALGSKMLPTLTKAAEKVTDIINDPKLSGSEKLDKLATMMGDAFSKGLAIAADKAAQIGPKVAESFVKGFLAADVWGRLAIGTFLFAKLGGAGALAKTGAAAGAATGTGMLAGMRGKLAGKGGLIGLGALFAAVAGPDLVKAFTEHGEKAKFAGKEFQFAAERMERLQRAGNMPGLRRAAADALVTADHLGKSGAPLRRLAEHYDKLGKGALDAGARIKRMGEDSSRSVKELRTRVGYNTEQIRKFLGENTKRGKEALTENFRAAARNVRKSMDAGTISTKRGLALIEEYMIKALQSMGFSKQQAISLRNRVPGSTQTPGPGGGLRPNQRGSFISAGAPSGDSVPSLLERGEYVLNRVAVRKIGRKNLDRINFALAPRFQQGGQVPRVTLSGPASSLRSVGQGALDNTRAAANQKLSIMIGPGPGAGATFGPKGIGTYRGLSMANWVIQALQHAARKGVSPQPTSGYRSHATNVAAGRNYYSEHEGTQYPHGAVDFGGYHTGLAEKMAVVAATSDFKYPLLAPIGFRDDGHASGTGHQRGGLIQRFASGGLVARAAQAAGFRGSNLLRAVAEAKGESGWNENAVGDGGNSIGLMQIHLPSHPWARGLNLRNPFVNMRAAMRVFRSQGWGAWHANHVPHIAAARAAIASIMGGGRGRGGGRSGGGRQATIIGGTDNYTQPHQFGGWGAGDFYSGLQSWASPGQQAAMNLAGLTPDLADDIAAASSALDFWNTYLPTAIASGDPNAINTVVGEINQWQDTLDGLTQATEEQNDLIQQQIAAQEAHTAAVNELKDQQKRNEDLIRAQGPSLIAALTQTVNGGIGGNAGLGRQFPSSAGLGGLSRA